MFQPSDTGLIEKVSPFRYEWGGRFYQRLSAQIYLDTATIEAYGCARPTDEAALSAPPQPQPG